jgi:hypothetical protein
VIEMRLADGDLPDDDPAVVAAMSALADDDPDVVRGMTRLAQLRAQEDHIVDFPGQVDQS